MTSEEFRRWVASDRFGWWLFGIFVAIEVLIVGSCVGAWQVIVK